MSEPTLQRSRWPRLLLILLPVWLIASGGMALWYYFHREKEEANVEQARFAQAVSIPMMKDDLHKFVEVIGERNSSSETAGSNLSRTAVMIDGFLGPSNTGYQINRHQGPGEWPLIEVMLRGQNPKSPPVWVVSSYDSRPGSRGGDANASGIAATLAAARAMASDKPSSSVHFVFLPHGNDPDGPIIETAAKFKEFTKTTGPAKALLVVEAMGGGESLWVSSRETSATPLNLLSGIGAVHGAEDICLGDDADLASVLFEMDLPAVRVSTRPRIAQDQDDEKVPFAPTVAASSGRLIELIRRCAASPKP